MSADIFRRVSAAAMMRWAQTDDKHFTGTLAATQNMVNIAVGMFPVKQFANNTSQIPNLGVPFLFKFCQRLPLTQPKHDSTSLATH